MYTVETKTPKDKIPGPRATVLYTASLCCTRIGENGRCHCSTAFASSPCEALQCGNPVAALAPPVHSMVSLTNGQSCWASTAGMGLYRALGYCTRESGTTSSAQRTCFVHAVLWVAFQCFNVNVCHQQKPQFTTFAAAAALLT